MSRAVAISPEGCLRTLVRFVSRENIDSVFAELAVPTEFDLLSLDVDQNTFFLWEGLAGYRPRWLWSSTTPRFRPTSIGRFATIRHAVWDGSQNFGASLKAFECLGTRVGIFARGCDFLGANAFFVRNDLVGDDFGGPIHR